MVEICVSKYQLVQFGRYCFFRPANNFIEEGLCVTATPSPEFGELLMNVSTAEIKKPPGMSEDVANPIEDF